MLRQVDAYNSVEIVEALPQVFAACPTCDSLFTGLNLPRILGCGHAICTTCTTKSSVSKSKSICKPCKTIAGTITLPNKVSVCAEMVARHLSAFPVDVASLLAMAPTEVEVTLCCVCNSRAAGALCACCGLDVCGYDECQAHGCSEGPGGDPLTVAGELSVPPKRESACSLAMCTQHKKLFVGYSLPLGAFVCADCITSARKGDVIATRPRKPATHSGRRKGKLGDTDRDQEWPDATPNCTAFNSSSSGGDGQGASAPHASSKPLPPSMAALAQVISFDKLFDWHAHSLDRIVPAAQVYAPSFLAWGRVYAEGLETYLATFEQVSVEAAGSLERTQLTMIACTASHAAQVAMAQLNGLGNSLALAIAFAQHLFGEALAPHVIRRRGELQQLFAERKLDLSIILPPSTSTARSSTPSSRLPASSASSSSSMSASMEAEVKGMRAAGDAGSALEIAVTVVGEGSAAEKASPPAATSSLAAHVRDPSVVAQSLFVLPDTWRFVEALSYGQRAPASAPHAPLAPPRSGSGSGSQASASSSSSTTAAGAVASGSAGEAAAAGGGVPAGRSIPWIPSLIRPERRGEKRAGGGLSAGVGAGAGVAAAEKERSHSPQSVSGSPSASPSVSPALGPAPAPTPLAPALSGLALPPLASTSSSSSSSTTSSSSTPSATSTSTSSPSPVRQSYRASRRDSVLLDSAALDAQGVWSAPAIASLVMLDQAVRSASAVTARVIQLAPTLLVPPKWPLRALRPNQRPPTGAGKQSWLVNRISHSSPESSLQWYAAAAARGCRIASCHLALDSLAVLQLRKGEAAEARAQAAAAEEAAKETKASAARAYSFGGWMSAAKVRKTSVESTAAAAAAAAAAALEARAPLPGEADLAVQQLVRAAEAGVPLALASLHELTAVMARSESKEVRAMAEPARALACLLVGAALGSPDCQLALARQLHGADATGALLTLPSTSTSTSTSSSSSSKTSAKAAESKAGATSSSSSFSPSTSSLSAASAWLGLKDRDASVAWAKAAEARGLKEASVFLDVFARHRASSSSTAGGAAAGAGGDGKKSDGGTSLATSSHLPPIRLPPVFLSDSGYVLHDRVPCTNFCDFWSAGLALPDPSVQRERAAGAAAAAAAGAGADAGAGSQSNCSIS